jgi:hypothetical protein
MAPSLHDAGLTVLGIDTFFYEGCDLIADRIDLPSATETCGTWPPTR